MFELRSGKIESSKNCTKYCDFLSFIMRRGRDGGFAHYCDKILSWEFTCQPKTWFIFSMTKYGWNCCDTRVFCLVDVHPQCILFPYSRNLRSGDYFHPGSVGRGRGNQIWCCKLLLNKYSTWTEMFPKLWPLNKYLHKNLPQKTLKMAGNGYLLLENGRFCPVKVGP